MSEQTTPETDALYSKMMAQNPSHSIYLEEFLSLAYRLERERDMARAKLTPFRIHQDRLIRELDCKTLAVNSLLRQLAEAQETLREIWQSGDAFLPCIDEKTTSRWRKAAGWEKEK